MSLRSSLLPLLLAAACVAGASADDTLKSRSRWVTRGDQTVQLTRYNNGYTQATRWNEDGNAVYRGTDGSGGTFRGAYNGATGNSRSVGTYADGTEYRSKGNWDGTTGRSRTVDENGNRSAWWSSYQTQYQSSGNRGRARSRSTASGYRSIPASE
jgi:hypothetical protein